MSPDSAGESLESRLPDRLSGLPVDDLRVPVGLLLVVLLLRPVVAHPLMAGYPQLAETILIWMLFAASFNLLLGYTGLLSFGHAMFFGIGAYGAAAGITRFGLPWLVAAPIGIVLSAVAAYAIARLIVEKGEIYFAMLTLAFAQAIHYVANQDPFGLTGGSNGITGAGPEWIDLDRGAKFVEAAGLRIDWYWVLGLVFVVAMLAIWQLVRSPFGRSLVAIRENDALARSMGMNVDRYKVWSFTFAGLFAAVAGALIQVNNQGATLELLSLLVSGDVILMTILGGSVFFFGPPAGAFVWLFAEDFLTGFETLHLPLSEFSLVSVELSGVLTYWQFFLGLLFVVVVLLSPQEGIWGLAQSIGSRLYGVVRR